jgi:hypothetical protein
MQGAPATLAQISKESAPITTHPYDQGMKSINLYRLLALCSELMNYD